MSTDEIKAIRKRWSQATDGPWAWESVGEKCNKWCIGTTMPVHEGQIVEHYDEETRTFSEKPEVIDFICESGSDGTFADADAIAHAPSDVSRLLAIVDEQAAEIRRLQRKLAELSGGSS